MTSEEKEVALWANEVQRLCILEADSVEDALAAAEVILSTDIHGREHKGKGPGGGQFIKSSTSESGQDIAETINKEAKEEASKDQPEEAKDWEDKLAENLAKSFRDFKNISGIVTLPKAIAKRTAKFLWDKCTWLLDKIPGIKSARRIAGKLAKRLFKKYGVKPTISGLGVGLGIYFRDSLLTNASLIPSVAKAIASHAVGAASVIKGVAIGTHGLAAAAGIGGTGTASTGGAVGLITSAVKAVGNVYLWVGGKALMGAGSLLALPPVQILIGVLIALETYRRLKKRYSVKGKFTEDKEKVKETFNWFMKQLDEKLGRTFVAGSKALSIDAYGRAHAPAGTSRGGQFLPKTGRSKHERLSTSPFTFQSPLSDSTNRDLDNLVKELDEITIKEPKALVPPIPKKGPITVALDKLSEWKEAVENRATQIIDSIPGGKYVRKKLKEIREWLTKRYGAKTMAAIVASGYALIWGAAGVGFISTAITGNPAIGAATSSAMFIPSPIVMLPGLALAELRYQLNKSDQQPTLNLAASMEEIGQEEIDKEAMILVKQLEKATQDSVKERMISRWIRNARTKNPFLNAIKSLLNTHEDRLILSTDELHERLNSIREEITDYIDGRIASLGW